ncbi:GerAB/ArcD/ProY family transporter [Alicyclobacillus ferrooxydans]|uniref:Spore gernimation protein n=1 Tax=Alicyclobacillus ferrooxydans TaxID=471514 RepID=A0A0P9GG33_9BACL|nr:GerAB/ArcD/ProY family transporter [Alicyclobacillus ferrooxydans]KPV38988.1 spore gernimation protein [Alicyclobacillus ferrooxydans]
MTPLSLFDKTTTFGGLYVTLFVNRIQMLYFVLIMPAVLIYPYMLWAILAVGVLSQINLTLLSKWISSTTRPRGYHEFVERFGELTVRIFALMGLFIILMRVSVITLGYVHIIHKFMFPTMDKKWLIGFIILAGWYVASKGMENTIRFVVIAFICGVWVIFGYIPFFFPPVASLHDLYPLIPPAWTKQSWEALLFIWSSFSGPEYLICLLPWLEQTQNPLKALSIANTMSTLEYLVIFTASILFFGSSYLSKLNIPVIHMIRYIQTPIFERVDLILISFHMFHFVFAIGILLLCFFGATRVALGLSDKHPSRVGFSLSFLIILLGTLAVNRWFWKSAFEENIWTKLQIWVGAATYTFLPVVLLLSNVLKRKVAE